MKTVFIQGTYDLLNAGHVRVFKLLREKYDRVVVGLNTDRLVAEHKPGQPIMPYEQRKELLEAIRWVDLVIPCDDKYALPYLKALGANVFATVEEWIERQADAIAWVKSQGGEVFVAPYFPDDGVTLSSSKIRAKIRGL